MTFSARTGIGRSVRSRATSRPSRCDANREPADECIDRSLEHAFPGDVVQHLGARREPPIIRPPPTSSGISSSETAAVVIFAAAQPLAPAGVPRLRPSRFRPCPKAPAGSMRCTSWPAKSTPARSTTATCPPSPRPSSGSSTHSIGAPPCAGSAEKFRHNETPGLWITLGCKKSRRS